jgi:hypothetical protein
MAQGDLYRILNDAYRYVKQSTEGLRAQMSTYPHEMRVSSAEVQREIAIQLKEIEMHGSNPRTQAIRRAYGRGTGATREQATAQLGEFGELTRFTDTQRGLIKQAADEFCQNVLLFLTQEAGKNFQIDVISGGGTEYTVRVSKIKDVRLSVYDFITKGSGSKGSPLAMAKTILKRRLDAGMKKAFPTRGQVATEVFFHLGHITAVSEAQAAAGLQSIRKGLEDVQTKWSVSEVAKSFIDFELLSKFTAFGNPEFAKQFEFEVAYVRPESEASNVTQSDYEKAVLKEVELAIKKVIDSNPNWADQASSDSLIEVLGKDLLETAKKRGAQVRTDIRKNTKSNKASKRLSLGAQTRKVSTKLGSINPEDYAPAASPVNLRSLIPMLNMRLPEYVRANMGQQGRLVNRTGRFAESTHIVDITEDAFATYSYMKEPYSVFESDRARDPRPLIEQSAREMAQEIMGFRFSGMRRV